MILFSISETKRLAVEQLLTELGMYDLQNIRQKCSVYNVDHEGIINSVQALCDSDVTDKETFKYVLSLLENDNVWEYFMEFPFNKDHELPQDIYWAITGAFSFSLLDQQIAQIDWLKYGFSTILEGLQAVSAFCINEAKHSDPREIQVSHPVEFNGKKLISVYGQETHGDFRLYQYDLSVNRMKSPVGNNEELPFAIPKKLERLIGYHSTETSFLAALIKLGVSSNIDLSELVQTDEFCAVYCDDYYGRTDVDDSDVSWIVSCYSSDNLPVLATEFSDPYKCEIVENTLRYYSNKKTVFTIYPEMVMPLIKGLLLKARKSNGRTSPYTLKAVLKGIIRTQESSNDLFA